MGITLTDKEYRALQKRLKRTLDKRAAMFKQSRARMNLPAYQPLKFVKGN